MNPLIFREYDIRGDAEGDLTPEVVENIGRAFGTYLVEKGKGYVAVGRDNRLSSDRLFQDLTRGILSTGINVTDLGLCPTPVFYFSLHHLDKDGGVMITGSHLEPDKNGLKICLDKDTIYGEEIQNIKRLIEEGKFSQGRGQMDTSRILPPYKTFLKQNIQLERGVRVVVDAGNGTGGLVAPELFKYFGCRVTELYCQPDGRFPNHEADPTVDENLRDLIETVRSERAEVGIALDGDADRIGVVDEKGGIIRGDRLLMIYARSVLKEKPGATVISEVKSSQKLYEDIERHGGRAIMWKTGHSLIKKKMKEEKSVLAGEMSGHMFFADRYFGYDDAVYASLRLLEILSASSQPLSDLLADVPRTFATPEIRVPCADDKKFGVVDRIKEFFQKSYQTIDVDGMRVLFDGGWGLVRASNTQPVLVLRFEADSEEKLAEIRNQVEQKLQDL